MDRREGSAVAYTGGPQAPTFQDRAPWDLIVLHLHVIHIEIQADGGPHCCW